VGSILIHAEKQDGHGRTDGRTDRHDEAHSIFRDLRQLTYTEVLISPYPTYFPIRFFVMVRIFYWILVLLCIVY